MANGSMNSRSIAAALLGLLLIADWVGIAAPAAAAGMFGFGGMRGGGGGGGGFVPRPGPMPGPGPWGRMPPPGFGGPPPIVVVPSGPPPVGGGPPPGNNRNGGGNNGGGGTTTAQANQNFVPDEVITAFAAGTTPQAIARVAQRYGLTPLETQSFPLIGTSLTRWRIGGGRTVATVVRGLGNENIVASVQPNYVFIGQDDAAKVDEATKPGPAAAPAAATPSAGPQYVLEKLQVQQAQQLATGKNILVAVIDSGIDTTLPELAGAITKSFDALTGGHPHPHGTSIAGAMAAHGKLIGIAPGAQILAVHAFDDGAGQAKGTSFAIYKGLQWAADNGARVVNMSFAGPADPLLQRMLAAAYDKGIVLIAAAGNAGPKSDPLYPAAYPDVVAVTATDSNDGLFALANRGRHIAVAAPGVDILALAPDGKIQFSTGTSIAAAHISGIAALLLERKPSLKPADIRATLISTAKPIGPLRPDSEFGAGLANAYGAVKWLERKLAEPDTGNAEAKQ